MILKPMGHRRPSSTAAWLALVFLVLASTFVAQDICAGPFSPVAGTQGSTAVSRASPDIAAWATSFRDYLPGTNLDANWKTPEKALGQATGDAFDIVGLGDGGQITLGFNGRIVNGAGYDFAVFENSFSDTFLELAWVEVSSNGTDFFRFPGFSLTASPVGGFGSIDPTNVDGFAGKYRQGYGTPFDLHTLAGVPGLDIDDVRYVRIIDIIGDGRVLDNWPSDLGGPHPIYDPYPTSGSAGFDLDAVAVLNFEEASAPEPRRGLIATLLRQMPDVFRVVAVSPVPEPTTYLMILVGLAVIFARAKSLISSRLPPQ